MRKLKDYAIIIGIIIAMSVVILILNTKNWNNGFCRRCGTELEYVGMHYEGKYHDIEKYDYECINGHHFDFVIKY